LAIKIQDVYYIPLQRRTDYDPDKQTWLSAYI